jgi:hypothetical protein
MAEVVRQLRVTFSTEEIKSILSERAKAIVLERKDLPCVEMARVEDVAGEATVILIVGNKPIEAPLRDKLIDARAALLHEVKNLTDQIEGRKPFGRTIPRLQGQRKEGRA